MKNFDKVISDHSLMPDNALKQRNRKFNLSQSEVMTILVHNPASYINRQSSLAKRKNIELNFTKTGSPINIKTGFFETNIYRLKNKIETKLKESK